MVKISPCHGVWSGFDSRMNRQNRVSGAAGCGYLTVTQEKQVGSNPIGTAKINVPLDKLVKSFPNGNIK